MRWTNLEPVPQGEGSQKEEDEYQTLTSVCTESRKMVLLILSAG